MYRNLSLTTLSPHLSVPFTTLSNVSPSSVRSLSSLSFSSPSFSFNLSSSSSSSSRTLPSSGTFSSFSPYRTMSTKASPSSSSPSSSSPPEPEILFQRHQSILRMNLNRPRALNSLSLSMIRLFETTLPTLSQQALSCIIMQGNGGKAFCAGGDIKQIVNGKNEINSLTGRNNQDAFFREEYIVDYRLANLTKTVPIIALWDGTVMGGGLGISIHSSFRIATEKTVFAMPETAIGLIPDVGGSYFLPRVIQGFAFGRYLALTGVRVTGADTVHAGLATHYVPSKDLPQVVEEITNTLKDRSPSYPDSYGIIQRILAPYQKQVPAFTYSTEDLDRIQQCFSLASVEEIIEASSRIFSVSSNSSASSSSTSSGGAATGKRSVVNDAVASLPRLCPTSLKVTFEQLNYGKTLSLEECYRMELRLVKRLTENSTDFYEGVRALLIDKDNKPKWNPDSLEKVTKDYVQSFFQPLPSKDELQLPKLQ